MNWRHIRAKRDSDPSPLPERNGTLTPPRGYAQPAVCITRNSTYAIPPDIGMVRIQAQIILWTTPHLIAFRRLAVPTPMIADEMLWVVETGMPRCDAARITEAALVSAAKPWIGCSLTSLWPRVLMIRQPPAAVPAAITTAQVTLIQVSMSPLANAPSDGCRNASQPGSTSRVPA